MTATNSENLGFSISIRFGNSHESAKVTCPEVLIGRVSNEQVLANINWGWLRDKWMGFDFVSAGDSKLVVGGFKDKDHSYMVMFVDKEKFDEQLFEQAILDVEKQIGKISGSGYNQKVTHQFYGEAGSVVLNFGDPSGQNISKLQGDGMLEVGRFVSKVVGMCHK